MPHSRPRPWPIWRSVLGAERKREEAWPTVAVGPDFGREPALARQEPLPAARGKRPVGKGTGEKARGKRPGGQGPWEKARGKRIAAMVSDSNFAERRRGYSV